LEIGIVIKEMTETQMVQLARQRRERATERCEGAASVCIAFCNAFLPKDLLSQFDGPKGHNALEMVALGFEPSSRESTWAEAGRRAEAFLVAIPLFRGMRAELARATAEENDAWEAQNDALRRELEEYRQVELI